MDTQFRNNESLLNQVDSAIIDDMDITLTGVDDGQDPDGNAAGVGTILDDIIVSDNAAFVPSQEDLDEHQKAQRREAARTYAEHMAKSPVYQAEVMYNNYIRSGSGPRFMSGQQKRSLKREFLRNARKGKYHKFFDQIYVERVTEEILKTAEAADKK